MVMRLAMGLDQAHGLEVMGSVTFVSIWASRTKIDSLGRMKRVSGMRLARRGLPFLGFGFALADRFSHINVIGYVIEDNGDSFKARG